MSGCTEERFFKDIEDHTMKTLRDDGVYRHLSFTNKGSSIYRFDLITWPGHLCISGDCGTYVFSRVTDMFEFFRSDRTPKPGQNLYINTGYWGEKLLSTGTNTGYEEYDEDVFRGHIIRTFLKSTAEMERPERKELWGDFRNEVVDLLGCGDIRDYDLASDFGHNGKQFFCDLWDFNFKKYTFSYLWCLYAVVHGVSEYDKQKLAKAA